MVMSNQSRPTGVIQYSNSFFPEFLLTIVLFPKKVFLLFTNITVSDFKVHKLSWPILCKCFPSTKGNSIKFYIIVNLKAIQSLYSQSTSCIWHKVELVPSVGWTPAQLSLVPHSVCGFHGRDLMAKKWECLVWKPQGSSLLFAEWFH